MHVACLAAIWTGIDLASAALCIGLYLLRIFAIGAGYHRYFAHRAYKTSRVFQFVLAVLAQSSAQRGVLWWAAKHRGHHRHSDTALDPHSPVLSGLAWAHFGWFFAPRHNDTELDAIPDFARFPELRWLDRHKYLPAAALAVAAYLAAGWSGLVVGFCWSTVLVWHATFSINSLAHLVGRKRYVTGDESRNNWFLALLTSGEGWHNNHHAYQSSARQGFRWWEVDPTFYALTLLSWLGLVWDLHTPPRAVIRGEQRLGRITIERAAQQLVASLPIDRIALQAQRALAATPSWAELQMRAHTARQQAEEFLAGLHLPHVPSLDEIRRHAEARLARTPSLDDIAQRTRELLLELIARQLLRQAEAESAG